MAHTSRQLREIHCWGRHSETMKEAASGLGMDTCGHTLQCEGRVRGTVNIWKKSRKRSEKKGCDRWCKRCRSGDKGWDVIIHECGHRLKGQRFDRQERINIILRRSTVDTIHAEKCTRMRRIQLALRGRERERETREGAGKRQKKERRRRRMISMGSGAAIDDGMGDNHCARNKRGRETCGGWGMG
jgi:hypothetical protein